VAYFKKKAQKDSGKGQKEEYFQTLNNYNNNSRVQIPDPEATN
jgi:hypothetical protein